MSHWKSQIKNWNGKLYKVLVNGKSCHGGKFEWSLPIKNEDGTWIPGKWTPTIENPIMCKSGWHLTIHYAHWSFENNCNVYEAEGDVVEFDGYDKVVCSRVRLLEQIENPYSGSRNSGDRNSGDYNSGNWNSGNRNSGNQNSGSYNSGNRNSGHYNSGSRNLGNWNSGNYNSGHRNSGYSNSGNDNSGNYNSGNQNTGYFCRQTPAILIFDKLAPKDWIPKFPNWVENIKILPIGYHETWQKAFENADENGVLELLALPNFDYDVFEEITSITREQIERKLDIKHK